MLRNSDGGGKGSDFLEKSVTKVEGAMLSALRGGEWGPISIQVLHSTYFLGV